MEAEFPESGGLAMPRRLLTAIFFVLCLSVCAPPAGSADGAPGLILSGSADSTVKLEVFSDFECPGCSYLFFNTIQPVLKNYKDRVSVIYYEFPLENMHPYARPAARYVSAAARLGDQKKLLTLFETLFADQDKWATDGNLEAAVSSALSPEDFKKVKSIMETEGDSIEREIDRDIQVGMDRKINATPTLFINHAGKQERVVMPPNVRDMYTLLSWRLNGLLK
jgi:protein-disulfide isomerase